MAIKTIQDPTENVPTIEPPKYHKRLEVTLDWKQYFFDFMDKHGEPINFEGRLLFPDGWTYSATDYQGPEWPPPKDRKELTRIQVAYWEAKRVEWKKEALRLANLLDTLRNWQDARSLPLKQVVTYQTEDAEGNLRVARHTGPIAFETINDHLEAANERYREALQNLGELGHDTSESD